MRMFHIFVLLTMSCCLLLSSVPMTLAQEPTFELPVQLIGFPVIILAVRLSNFVKKLAYSLNPQTYSASSGGASANSVRSRRHAPSSSANGAGFDPELAESKLVQALGHRVCVMERECVQHAVKSSGSTRAPRDESGPAWALGEQPDWEDILSGYKSTAMEEKQWYLLSVFIGDIMRSPNLCRQLAKRRPCADQEMVS